MAKSEKKLGRPSAITPEVLERLRQAFSIGCQPDEAAVYADIARSTLYLHMKNDEDFSDKITAWQKTPILKAREVVMKGINKGDKTLAWDYLQKKCKDEFSTKTESVVRNVNINTEAKTPEEAAKIYADIVKKVE